MAFSVAAQKRTRPPEADYAGRDVTLEAVEKAREFLVPVALHALADDRAVENVERREQGGRAIADVIERHRAGAPALHRQTGLGSVQGLDLTFLINREHGRVHRRVDVKPDHIAHLGDVACAPAFFIFCVSRASSRLPQTQRCPARPPLVTRKVAAPPQCRFLSLARISRTGLHDNEARAGRGGHR
jgi:hypothetical protein